MKTNKLNAINNLHKYINKVTPLIIDGLRDSNYKFKSDGTIFKKDRDLIKNILLTESNKNKYIRDYECYFDDRYNYTKYLKFKISYKNTPDVNNYCSNSYYTFDRILFNKDRSKDNYALITSFNKLPVFSQAKVKTAENKVLLLKNKISALNSELSVLNAKFLNQINNK